MHSFTGSCRGLGCLSFFPDIFCHRPLQLNLTLPSVQPQLTRLASSLMLPCLFKVGDKLPQLQPISAASVPLPGQFHPSESHLLSDFTISCFEFTPQGLAQKELTLCGRPCRAWGSSAHSFSLHLQQLILIRATNEHTIYPPVGARPLSAALLSLFVIVRRLFLLPPLHLHPPPPYFPTNQVLAQSHQSGWPGNIIIHE